MYVRTCDCAVNRLCLINCHPVVDTYVYVRTYMLGCYMWTLCLCPCVNEYKAVGFVIFWLPWYHSCHLSLMLISLVRTSLTTCAGVRTYIRTYRVGLVAGCISFMYIPTSTSCYCKWTPPSLKTHIRIHTRTYIRTCMCKHICTYVCRSMSVNQGGIPVHNVMCTFTVALVQLKLECTYVR